MADQASGAGDRCATPQILGYASRTHHSGDAGGSPLSSLVRRGAGRSQGL